MFDLESFRAEADSVLAELASWARTRQDVESIILVGSWARYRASQRVDSDIDVILLVSDVAVLLADDACLDALVPGEAEIRREAWGLVTERRMLLPSGLIVEFGITTAPWAALPLDAGRRVCSARARAPFTTRAISPRRLWPPSASRADDPRCNRDSASHRLDALQALDRAGL